MTLTDWVRQAAKQYGLEWAADNYASARNDLGRDIPYTSFTRTIAHVRAEMVATGKATEIGERLEPAVVSTPDESVLYHDVDTSQWKPRKLRTGTYGGQQQVRIEWERRDELTPGDFANAFMEAVKSHKPKYPTVRRPDKKTGLTAEPCLYDLHLDRTSWSSPDEARDVFLAALADLFRGYKRNQFDRIIFPIGNDFLNWDNWNKTTTAGTQMQSGNRPDEIIAVGQQTLTAGIDYLTQFGDVDVVVVPGNHDWLLSHMLGRILAAWYRDSKNVTVDDGLDAWKYRSGPGWLLALTHGKEPGTKRAMKAEDLAAALPLKAPELWRENQYREVQTGHLHHKNRGYVSVLRDVDGVVVRRVASLAPRDDYEGANLYMANREAELIVFDDHGPRDYRSHRP